MKLFRFNTEVERLYWSIVLVKKFADVRENYKLQTTVADPEFPTGRQPLRDPLFNQFFPEKCMKMKMCVCVCVWVCLCVCLCVCMCVTGQEQLVCDEWIQDILFCFVLVSDTFFKKNLEDINPFRRAADTPVLDFWWRLPWVPKPGWVPCVLSHLCDPQIHLWCDTCWLYGGQYGNWAFSIHVLADVSTSIDGGQCYFEEKKDGLLKLIHIFFHLVILFQWRSYLHPEQLQSSHDVSLWFIDALYVAYSQFTQTVSLQYWPWLHAIGYKNSFCDIVLYYNKLGPKEFTRLFGIEKNHSFCNEDTFGLMGFSLNEVEPSLNSANSGK